MGGILGGSKPPAPDTSEIDRQRQEREDEKAKVERDNTSKRRNAKRGGSARSLLLFDSPKGVDGSAPKQKTLG